jgi:hypothetical protein
MNFMLNTFFTDAINIGICRAITKKEMESGQYVPMLDAVNDII